MRLFDERTGGLHDVEIRPRMSVYVCGITPYDSAHLGHAFTYTHFDILVRYLRHLGAEVTHVQNITDVDDDILRVSRERGVDFRELADREVAKFELDMAAIGIERPTHTPRATQYVPAMVEEVQALMSAGHGYERDGTVYFRVSSDPGYGRLSGLRREEMIELAKERGGHPEDPAKDDPLDFVLWQRSQPGEPWWDSPWGRGRPGWHIECSTMSRRLLGQQLDVHGGGKDLIFPHHESELAQAEGVPEARPFVRHWVHTGEVKQGVEKMSKSLGNLTFVRDLLQHHSGSAIRSLLLRHHYREDWEFREEGLEAGVSGYDAPVSSSQLRDRFFSALDEDLNAPAAMAILDVARSRGREGEALLEEGRALLGLDL